MLTYTQNEVAIRTRKRCREWLQQENTEHFPPNRCDASMRSLLMAIPNADPTPNNAYNHNLILGLLMNEVVQCFERRLQPFLTDLEAVLRHLIGSNLY